jgi:hypothetical protein
MRQYDGSCRQAQESSCRAAVWYMNRPILSLTIVILPLTILSVSDAGNSHSEDDGEGVLFHIPECLFFFRF